MGDQAVRSTTIFMKIWWRGICRRLASSAINLVRKSRIWGQRSISDAPRAGPSPIAEPSLPQYALFLVQFTLDYVKKLLLLARRWAFAWCRLRLRQLLPTSHRLLALLLQLANLCLLGTHASLHHHLRRKRAGTPTLAVRRQLHDCLGVCWAWHQQKLLLRVVSQACEACLAGIYLHKLGKQLEMWQLLGEGLLLKGSWWISELWLGHQMRRIDLLRSIQILDKIISHLICHHQLIWWRCIYVNGYRFNNPRESGSIATTDLTINVFSEGVVHANVWP